MYTQFDRQGQTWHDLRVALTSELTAASTVLGFFPALNIVADSFIELIRRQRVGYKVTGFEELAYKMGLESTCTLILGRHLGFLKPDSSSELATRLAEAVRIHFTASRDAFYGLPLWKLLPTCAYKQLIESEDAIYKYVWTGIERVENSFATLATLSCVQRTIRRRANFQYHFGDHRDHYTGETRRRERRVGGGHFSIHSQTKEPRYTGQESGHCRFHSGRYTHGTRNNYSNSTISLLSSLIDLSLVTNYFTSLFLHFSQLGNTLVFLFDLIGRNPTVQNKLYEETYALAPAGCDLTIDNLRKAKYLRACITESLRLIPTTTCIARILDEPIELSGYRLTAGTVVLLHTWIAGLNEENFKDAKKYLPERWTTPTTPHSPLLVAPFGAGRRICPGKRFVDLALQLILAKIIREFEIIVEEELDLQFEFILAPKGPVSLGFRDRS
ncbi:cytochrome P450 314A1 isoform X6 [Apis mellifera]|uniref:Cytochrome P450 314A1 isoform X6 n=1 Tax=Apis mellifera TaxID=7460 RepID=A0A7M7L6N9_APIME|nr:cytochrome P450 314A1 isoform X6 [Apis mellifera]XP_026296313.1 cytochrome P450 314A1 isoform X6 [Apis mellifera]|eukprot:XP_026296312.1 cytochrome P450 314A1 isoform X6 [Apis mellifera]